MTKFENVGRRDGPGTGGKARKDVKGMVVREQYSEHPPRHEYYLTEAAAALGPVFSALREWGTQFVTS
jgi:hypothetical protein